MRGTDAGYYSPGYRGRGNYSYEDVSESRRRSEYRASGSYEYGSPVRRPAGGGSGRGVDVRVLDDDAPPPPPQRIYVRERQQPDIEIYHQRAPQPRIRYQDEGGEDGYGDQYFEPRGRGPAPRGRDDYDDGYAPATRREERIPYKPQEAPSDRNLVIRQANEEGPGVYKVNGKFYEAEDVDGRWKIYRTDEPMDYRPASRVDGGRAVSRADSDRGPREAAKPEKKSGFTLGNTARVALRVAGYGLLGAGAFYALSGVVGGITNGMDWGPMLGRTALNWQQAVPAIIGGGVMAAGGGLLMKFTKKKEA